jgi:hypothetical protein
MAKRQFLLFDDAGGKQRSSIEPIGEDGWLEALKDGRRVRRPAKPPRFRIVPPLPRAEDMPWCGAAHVVSSRLRRFLQQEAPGHAQFFKAEVTGPKKLLAMLTPLEPYYVVNWLHLIDCIDLKKSEYDVEHEPGEEPDYTFFRLKLDPARVPPDVLIFRLKYESTTTVIDARLAEKIRRAGFVGPQFDPVQGIAEAMGF